MMTPRSGVAARARHRAFARGRYVEAIDLIVQVRDNAHRFGGSHAQRDLVALDVVEAALCATASRPARALHQRNASTAQAGKPMGRAIVGASRVRAPASAAACIRATGSGTRHDQERRHFVTASGCPIANRAIPRVFPMAVAPRHHGFACIPSTPCCRTCPTRIHAFALTQRGPRRCRSPGRRLSHTRLRRGCRQPSWTPWGSTRPSSSGTPWARPTLRASRSTIPVARPVSCS